MKPKVLIIEDISEWANLLARNLMDLYDPIIAENGKKGLRILDENEPNCIILDLGLPDYKNEEDLPLLIKLLNQYPHVPSIVFTGHDDPSLAVKAARLGAFDYFSKRLLDIDKLKTTVKNAIEKNALQLSLKDKINGELANYPLIGNSPSIIKLRKMISKVAPSDAPILLSGESGTGKEIVARHLHYNSNRSNRRFEVASVPGMDPNLAYSELFGHVKGAFTGATDNRPGKFELADEGTLFLDDVDLCPPKVQEMLLRVLEGQKFRPLGGNIDHNVNVRIIASTNKDLKKLSEDGDFRQDLYYRLAGITVDIPPLRDRLEDIRILAAYFLENEIRDGDKRPQRFSDLSYSVLREYHWPGNVRELKHVVKALHILTSSEIIDADDIQEQLKMPVEEDNEANSLRAAVNAFKREFIQKKLIDNDYNVSRTAVNIGITRQQLQNLMKSFEIDKP